MKQPKIKHIVQLHKWLMWAEDNARAANSLIEGTGAVIPIFRYANGQDYLNSKAMVHLKDDPAVNKIRLDRPYMEEKE